MSKIHKEVIKKMKKSKDEILAIITQFNKRKIRIHVEESDNEDRIILIADIIRLCKRKNFYYGFNTDKNEVDYDFVISRGLAHGEPLIQAGTFYVGKGAECTKVTVKEAKRIVKILNSNLKKHKTP